MRAIQFTFLAVVCVWMFVCTPTYGCDRINLFYSVVYSVATYYIHNLYIYIIMEFNSIHLIVKMQIHPICMYACSIHNVKMCTGVDNKIHFISHMACNILIELFINNLWLAKGA